MIIPERLLRSFRQSGPSNYLIDLAAELFAALLCPNRARHSVRQLQFFPGRALTSW